VFDAFTEKSVAPEQQLHVAHGQPLRFGKDKRRGLRLVPGKLELEIVTLGERGVTEADLLVHDEQNRALAGLLAGLQPPAFPMALGVLYCDPATPYDRDVEAQLEAARSGANGDLSGLLTKGRTWQVT
jgi:2-oxoglutarate ferredoxin oxidoreductase subunit beta